MSKYDPAAVRADFPALAPRPDGTREVYLDAATTSLLPGAVIDAVACAQRAGLASPGRTLHAFSERAASAYEQARADVQRFLGAGAAGEVVFTGGATESLNLVARGFAEPRLQPGDEVVVSVLEHHANLLPWQRVCHERGGQLRVAQLCGDADADVEAVTRALSQRTRVVALTHVSNVLGCLVPIARLAPRVHECGAVLVVDGAQAVAHVPVDVQALGCDFYAFSAHKLYGPTGIGVLWGRGELLENMQPLRWGGGMIERVSHESCTLTRFPARFEAGTPNVSGAVGLGAALAYLAALDPKARFQHARDLVALARRRLSALSFVRVLGDERAVGLVSFVVESVHPHDLGTVAASCGVALRTGHHCAEPLMRALGLSATTRASFGVYNDEADVEALIAAVERARRLLA